MMTAHHQGVVDMSNDALKKAEHQEIKDLAMRIIAAQTAEIRQMWNWKSTWNK